jgi:hypothetical protein
VDKNIHRLNFLKYSEGLWKFFIKNKISYHNRLRETQFLEIFKKNQAKIISIHHELEPDFQSKLHNMKINKMFAHMSHEELAVYYSEVLMQFPIDSAIHEGENKSS